MNSQICYLILLSITLINVDARVCPSMDIRNNPENLNKLQGCTKINGYLKIVLMEDYSHESYSDYYFPELKEITHYFMLFRVFGLVTLSSLFPNLSVIGGVEVFGAEYDAILIIFYLPDLERIDLSNLISIGGGKILIDKCPLLCFVTTVDWEALGTSLATYSEESHCRTTESEVCPFDCNGHCWSHSTCQNFYENCDPQCLGCTKQNSSMHCIVCRNYKDGNNCIESCSPRKFRDEENMACLSKDECTSRTGFFTFKKLCVDNCPDKYQLITDGNTKKCKYCGKNCKYCNGIVVKKYSDLEYLAGCTHITGHLEFKLNEHHLFNALESRLQQIEEIEGCLKIGRSSAVFSLNFLKNLRRIRGIGKNEQCRGYSIFIYDNTNLNKLITFNNGNNLIVDNATVSFHDNPLLCPEEIVSFLKNIGMNISSINDLDDKDVSYTSNGDNAACNVLNINITTSKINSINVTLCWSLNDDTNKSIIGYTILYTMNNISENFHLKSVDMCEDFGWQSKFITTSCVDLVSLEPFTTYYYFIKVYNYTKILGMSEIKNFTTLPDDPFQPEEFTVKAISSSEISLSWEPTSIQNGIISHYVILAFLEYDDPHFLNQRNYCKNPHISSINNDTEFPVEDSICECSTRIFKKDQFCESSFADFSNNDCNKYFYSVLTPKIINTKMKRYLSKTKSNNDYVLQEYVEPKSTSYVLKSLKHFSTYIILFSVCNKNDNTRPMCSGVLFDTARTLPNISADSIQNLKIEVVGSNAVLTWDDPENPNGFIVAYHVQYNLSQTENIETCITKLDFEESGRSYVLTNLNNGLYSVRVKVVSLAGPGLYSKFKLFKISAFTKTFYIILLVIITFIILTLILIYMWLKHKNSIYNIKFFTSMDGKCESSFYIEDNWELKREDIEIKTEIINGKFAVIYEGYIPSKRLKCAVKSVKPNISVGHSIELLIDGSAIKKLSESYHVVKLYGIVSRGDPPMIVMEYMKKGNLKQFLLEHKQLSDMLTFEQLYLMSAQIADGMAYISSKNYIHKDLAARNCLVSSNNTVKIGDFGMSKELYPMDYYDKGPKGLIPVRWMSPESLKTTSFTLESDVWSYGVLLWEIVTHAEQPYGDMFNEEVFNFITHNGCLKCTNNCPNILHDIMSKCFIINPQERPTFIEIVKKLEPLAGNYFSTVCFTNQVEKINNSSNKNKKGSSCIENETSFLDTDYLIPVDDPHKLFQRSLNE